MLNYPTHHLGKKDTFCIGKFAYESKDALLDFLVQHMPNPDNQPEAERRALYDSHLSQLKHWK